MKQEMKPHILLDFSLLPNLSYTKAWVSLDKDIQAPLSRLSETYDRADASLKFGWFMCSTAERLCCSEDDTIKTREAFLRASLGEFVSMEDALERDLKIISADAPPLRIRSTNNPMLHIVRELRNLEFHLRSSKLSSNKKKVMWGNINKLNEASELEHEIFMINDISLDAFNALRNSRYYNDGDKVQLINWFNKAQKKWGVIDFVIRAVNIYAKMIVEKHLIDI